MSVHFIAGKPGGGKSLYSLRLMVRELAFGSRCIVTNLAIRPGELNEYLQREYPSKVVDLVNRLRILDDDETGRFWTIRGPGSSGPVVLTKEEWNACKLPDYSGVSDSGVFYCIDEVHNYFNARAWMGTGKDVLFYLSQHRKLGDTVLAVTQAVLNVDKQFRSIAQDFTYIRNVGKEKTGDFKLPSVFMRRSYLSPATETSTPMETGTFRLDVSGLASCYDTSAGVGIHGAKSSDTMEKRTGISWVWGAGLAVAIVALFVFGVPKLFGFGLRAASGTVNAAIVDIPRAAGTRPPILPERTIGIPDPVPPPPARSSAVGPAPAAAMVPEVFLMGYYRVGDRVEWALSDGRRVHPSDDDFRRGGSDFLELAGQPVIRRKVLRARMP